MILEAIFNNNKSVNENDNVSLNENDNESESESDNNDYEKYQDHKIK